jgi:hypothetical protein
VSIDLQARPLVVAGVVTIAFLLTLPSSALAQQIEGGVVIDGPPPPTGSSLINQQGEAGATLRAVRVHESLSIDGVIDEPFYRDTPPITEFIQSVPNPGAAPTQRTEAWIAFDDDNVYVAAKIYDTEGPNGWIANEMRRDSQQLRTNDNFGVWLDTFYDRRNAVGFYGNAIGGMSDLQITNEGNPNFDWNPVRDTKTALFDGGWSIELAIPFKSLRYRPGKEQVWGIQMRRSVLRQNEWEHITALPLSVAGSGSQGIFRVSMYATLVGIEAPPPSRNFEVKPYGISGLRSDLTSTPTVSNDAYADAGLDLKYGITENLTLDLTYNTDFAQVEVDEQQVNLTRFSLSFPEKREFFLEGRGIFNFASGGVGGGGGGPGGGGGGSTPTLFYSRQIGLQGGQAVPILGGGRLTGKVGSFDVGLINIQTQDDADVLAQATNFSVFRLRKDLFDRSSVGVLFENRSRSVTGSGSNQTWGVDGSFPLTNEMSLLGYYAQTRTDGLDGMDASYRAQIGYEADELGFTANHLVVGADFNPEIGFARRKDFRQTSASARFSPRTRSISWIRQLTFQTSGDYITNEQTGDKESTSVDGSFGIEFENSDQFNVRVSRDFERFLTNERISGAVIPAGDYTNPQVRASYNMGPQRPYQASLSFTYGDYYGGTLTSAGIGRGRIEVTPQISVEPSVSFNWITLPQGTFNQHVAVTRVTYTMTPRAYVSGLLQYNTLSHTLSGNFRFRWEWAPGSELFLVYTEDRNTDVLDRWSVLQNRGLVIKVNRLLRI